ncbi:uncharacterized protein [Spinacia oleracea]|uniref:Reverse transcriptase domain-containing protein n=1 Tax=Spinacia oleracea TaxID=3562 RepID=A0ABM3QYC5_SPIOL|nr:uncharacterized protein LOC130463298 [Spinacia oleracea]
MHIVDTRRPMWRDVAVLSQNITSNWLVMGDFNSVLLPNERHNGNAVTDAETRDFEACVDNSNLTELKSCGNFYSWSNKGQGDLRISSRIDMAFGNIDWHSTFTDAIIDYVNPGLSDHSPLVMTCKSHVGGGSRPFKFFNYMAEHDSFLSVVKKGWEVQCHGTAMLRVWSKLKAVNHGLKNLHHKEFAKLDDRIELIRGELASVQLQLAATLTDSSLQTSEKIHSEKLMKFLQIQECAYKKKSRIMWLKVGDSNTKFLFSAMKERKKLTTIEEIKEEVSSFYKSLIGTAASTLESIDVNIVRKGKQLTFDAAERWVQPVLDVEIDNALKDIDIIKAQGLDGLDSLFFLKAWNIVKLDIYEAVKDFFRTRLISKILTARMQAVIDDMVNCAQSWFIPGRVISDNILLSYELVKCYSRKVDEGFVKAIFSTFKKFSTASSQEANLHKSEVYLAGISSYVADHIMATIGIPKGTFPFKYLGVPLTTRGLSFTDFKPLIENTVARIKSWAARLLSFVGRLQLVKSILFGIQLYWCKIFVMPRKIMKEI